MKYALLFISGLTLWAYIGLQVVYFDAYQAARDLITISGGN
jgi:hypothetical protein